MLCSASFAAILALLLALCGGVGGATLATVHASSLESGNFRVISVPYRVIMAPRENVSSLAASLALGNLLAYEPRAPTTEDLLLFLPGSWAGCDSYSELLETIAGQMHVLCLPYDNRKAIAQKCLLDGNCYKQFRMEAYNGSFGSIPGNNIEQRLASALVYLDRAGGSHGENAWGRYLDGTSGLPLWSRIRAAGHSQGAGAAAYIGYLRELPRVVQLSGVCDHSDWTRTLGTPATPASRFFGLASMFDQVKCPSSIQVASWRAEGALPMTARPLVLAREGDFGKEGLGSAHFVISSIAPPGCNMIGLCIKSHDSTAVNDIWTGRSPYANGLWQALFGS